MRTTAQPLSVDPTHAFQPTADPASLWLIGQYDDALRMLRAAVLRRQGLLALVGESGTGKTVLAHALTVRVRDDAVVVGRLLHPILEGLDVLAAVAEAFGLPATFKDRGGFVDQFRRFVAETVAAGRRVLLIVDDAQRLNREWLLELGRLPYADGAGITASLSVLFVGHRGLLDALRADAMEPDVLCHLQPLTREQTAGYIAHRLRAVRHRGRIFTPSALRKIWVVSEGIPRAANALCVDALSHLQHTERRTVTAAMIARWPRKPEAPTVPDTALAPVGEAPIEPLREQKAPRRRLASLVGAGCLALTLVAIMAVKRSDRVPSFLAGPVATTASTVTAVNAGAEDDMAVARTEGAVVPAESTAEPEAIVEVARPPAALPDPPTRPTATASRPRVAIPVAKRAPAAEDGDATVIIDWLLKARRPGGGARRE